MKKNDSKTQFYGPFRGIVLNNLDPLGRGRLIVEVPAISGALLNWAEPCMPYTELIKGDSAIPPIGTNVWVEFEGGDPNYPVWIGCFWGKEAQ